MNPTDRIQTIIDQLRSINPDPNFILDELERCALDDPAANPQIRSIFNRSINSDSDLDAIAMILDTRSIMNNAPERIDQLLNMIIDELRDANFNPAMIIDQPTMIDAPTSHAICLLMNRDSLADMTDSDIDDLIDLLR